MPDIDLTAAIEEAAKAFHTFVVTEGHASEDAPETWDVIDDEGKEVLIEAMGAAIAVAAPHIVKAALASVGKFADDMETWCSPYGVAVTYSARLREHLDRLARGGDEASRG